MFWTTNKSKSWTKNSIFICCYCYCCRTYNNGYKNRIFKRKFIFIQLLSYTLILYFAVYPTVPKHYWLVNVALIGFSIVLDILWLAFYAPVWWWSKSDSSNSLGFQRFHIILASILLLVKCFTTVLLFIGFKPTNT